MMEQAEWLSEVITNTELGVSTTAKEDTNETSASRSGNAKKLSIDDLFADIGNDTGFAGLKKAARTLRDGVSAVKGGAKSAVRAPLAPRIQDRLDRAVAYKATKQQVSKWEPKVKELREASHVSFPLPNQHRPNQASASRISATQLALKLQRQADGLVEEKEAPMQINLADMDMLEADGLGESDMTLEDLKKKQADIRMMREQMFRQDLKAKRIAKIKSKTYRRIHKRERERQAEKTGATVDVDEQDEIMRLEAQRAEERMSLRHKNTGKWAKQALRFGRDQDTRQALADQLQKHEELKRKIEQVKREDADDNSEDDAFFDGMDGEYDEYNENADEPSVKKSASKALLAKIDLLAQDQLEQAAAQDSKLPGKGIFNMKFMVEAEERKRQENLRQLDALKEEIEEEDAMAYDDDSDNERREPKEENAFVNVDGNSGRMVFNVQKQPTRKTKGKVVEEDEHEEEEEKEMAIFPGIPSETSGPLLKGFDEVGLVTLGASKPAAPAAPAVKEKKEQKPEEVKATTGGISEISVENLQEKGATEGSATEETSEVQPFLSQREIIQRAFADADILAKTFADEKMQAQDEDYYAEFGKAKSKDDMPGWGSWDGPGIQNKRRLERIAAKKKADEKKRMEVAKKRKDAKLGNVIISEKKIKKTAKYALMNVPHPYKSMGDYREAMGLALGKEWNSVEMHNNLIKPRVLAKSGVIIEPMAEWIYWPMEDFVKSN